MNSGSSELLLDRQQQQAELERKRKLLELASAKVKPVEKRVRTLKEKTKFYCTSTLAFFSVTAGASLLFLVPLYVDPAISTLVGDFIEVPTTCITTRREDLIGLFNCSWSSCREGCTSDFFRCTHIYVTYVEANFTYPYNVTASELVNMTDLERYVRNEESMLMVNIKGCGYPPSIKCKNFTENYGYEGATFPCHYSRLNKSVVMPHYKRSDQIAVIRNYFVIPFIVTVISSIGLCVIHCDCRCKKERNRRRHQRYRRPKVENLSDSSISTRVDMLTPGTEAYKQPPQL